MKINLISPASPQDKKTRKFGQIFRFPQLALPIVAALTPEDVEISITDEVLEEIDFNAAKLISEKIWWVGQASF